jgi:nucleotidyltransferase/DNA polymerase involved in DNA repair
VGVLDPGVFTCDLAGTEELLGSPARIARRVLARCARAGAPASAGIGPTPFVARVVAERTPAGEVRMVDNGRAFLAPLPLEVLPVDEKVREELRLLGLRVVGEFAVLPRGAVFDRFGSAVARAHALARGEYGDLVRAAAPPRRIRARRAWDDAIASREQLVFALRVVVDQVSATLARDGLAALRLDLRLDREEAAPLRLERAVLPPTRESAALLRSLRWALEECVEIGLVIGCALEVPEVEPARGRQIGLFAPDGARQEEAIAAARYLRAKLGRGTVLRARVADTDARLPERASEWVEVIA